MWAAFAACCRAFSASFHCPAAPQVQGVQVQLYRGVILRRRAAGCYNECMSIQTIRELLDREPFEPFKIVTSSGESYPVSNPHLVAMMKSRLFIALPDGDRWTFVNYLHITAVDALTNGHRASPRRRKRR